MDRAIYDAFRKGDTEAIAALIEAGVPPDFRRLTGETCLHAAAHAGALELAKGLVQRGADRRARDIHGNKPIDLAIQETQQAGDGGPPFVRYPAAGFDAR